MNEIKPEKTHITELGGELERLGKAENEPQAKGDGITDDTAAIQAGARINRGIYLDMEAS